MVEFTFVVKDEMGFAIKSKEEVKIIVEGEKEAEEAKDLEAFVKENI